MESLLEREIKIPISRQEYDVLFELAHSMSATHHFQMNYYFDTPKLQIYRQKAALKLRSDGRYRVILKKNQQIGAGFSNSREYQVTLNRDFFTALLDQMTSVHEVCAEIETVLSEMKVYATDLSCLGQLTTKRTRFSPIEGVGPLELDMSTYLGQTDYELEWEIDDVSQMKAITAWLADHQLEIRKINESKYTRFLRKKGMLGKEKTKKV